MKVVLFDLLTGGHHVRHASYFIRHLVESGDHVTFITWKPDPSLSPLMAEDMKIDIKYVVDDKHRDFGQGRFRQFKDYSRGIRYCHNLATELQADIIHHLYLEYSEPSLYLRAAKAHRRRWKLFGTLYWSYFLHEAGEQVSLPKRLYHRLNRWALGRLLKQDRLNYLFVHTERMKDLIASLYGDDSLNNRIIVVPDAIEPFKNIPRELARKELGLPAEKTLILFFGVFNWYKGADILFDALTLLKGDWCAVVAGKPADVRETDAQYCRKRLQDPERLITRFGFVPDEDVTKYYSAADVVVLPYRRAFKGTSGILQHAAAAGKPVVASDVGQVGPTVREEGLGILVEPESPESLARGIQQFLDKGSQLSRDVRPRALRYAAGLDWRIMAKKVRAAYLSAVEDRIT